MKNYLIISSEFPPGPGGIGQHAASVAKALATYGKVTVVTNQDYAEDEEKKSFVKKFAPYAKVQIFTRNKLGPVQKLNESKRLVKQLNPDLIFTTGRLPILIGAWLKFRQPKRKIVAFAHGSEITDTDQFLSKLSRWAINKMDRVYAVSTFTASLLKDAVKKEKILVVPNGLDADFLVELNKDKKLEKYDWPGSPKLLTVGNVSPRKGQHRVIKTLPTLLKVFPDLHYHMVGLPADAITIKALAEELGVTHAITIHGRLPARNDLYRALKTADAFIMLSENQPNGDLEGFGIAILEANAFGIPAIGAKYCGIEDAISAQSGRLVDGDNAEEVAAALQEILQQKDVLHTGAKAWAEKHNWAEIIKNIKE